MDILWNVLTVLVVLVLVYLFMVAPRMLGRINRTPFQNRHYAHRGLFDNASEAPENSLAAFRKAVEAGYGIELDVQLSKDDKLVVFHDATLKRMCGVEGKVWEYTLEELKQFRLLDSNEQIPTFEEFLEVVDGKVPFILEYKLDRAQTRVCELADRVLRNYQGPYCIECFHPLAVMWYRNNRPDIMRGQLCEEHFRNEQFKGKPIYTIMSFLLPNVATRPDFVAYNFHHAGNISRRICKWMGALSVAYTVKSEEDYAQAKDQFDLFIFDSFKM
jgi:glycerophosphoryl diester phosphodiesterase